MERAGAQTLRPVLRWALFPVTSRGSTPRPLTMNHPRLTQIVFASLLSLLPSGAMSCSSVDLAPAPRVEARLSAASSADQARDDFWKRADFMVRGRVLDDTGEAVKAKVALVDGNGSTSTGTGPEGFDLGGSGGFPHTLCAWTPDGRIGWSVLEAADLEGEVRVEGLQPGAQLTLVPGDYHDRVSIEVDGVPIHNVKFPAGEPRTFVVPARQISFGTVGTKDHPADRRTARLSPGETMTVSF